jgi:hypothetical protein
MTGRLNCADEEDFLNRYSRVVDGKMKKMPHRVVREIRQKLLHHISASLDIDECEKESAARELTVEKWGGRRWPTHPLFAVVLVYCGPESPGQRQGKVSARSVGRAAFQSRQLALEIGGRSVWARLVHGNVRVSTAMELDRGDTCFVTLKTLQDRAGGSDRQRRAARQAAIAISRCAGLQEREALQDTLDLAKKIASLRMRENTMTTKAKTRTKTEKVMNCTKATRRVTLGNPVQGKGGAVSKGERFR